MEIEKAIKNLTAYIFYAMDDMPKQVGESISVAISALRAPRVTSAIYALYSLT